jgi:hypothetical protein
MLKIVNEKTESYISLCKKESIELELCLNVTKYGILWKDIGDALYEYGISYEEKDYEVIVTNDQFNFLKMLKTKESWRQCSRL